MGKVENKEYSDCKYSKSQNLILVVFQRQFLLQKNKILYKKKNLWQPETIKRQPSL